MNINLQTPSLTLKQKQLVYFLDKKNNLIM